MALTTPESEAIIDLVAAEVVSEQPYEWRIESTTDKHLIVIDRLCRDSMSGRLYPYQVDLQESDRMYSGCGGDSEWLLPGATSSSLNLKAMRSILSRQPFSFGRQPACRF